MDSPRPPIRGVEIGGVVVIVVDLVTKLSISALAAGSTSGPFIPIRNHEFSLGIAGAPPSATILIAAIGIALAAAFVIPPTQRGELQQWIPACLIGGSLANLIDRIAFGSVHDFIATPWVVLNLADLAVLAALVGIVAARLRHQPAESANAVRTLRRQ